MTVTDKALVPPMPAGTRKLVAQLRRGARVGLGILARLRRFPRQIWLRLPSRVRGPARRVLASLVGCPQRLLQITRSALYPQELQAYFANWKSRLSGRYALLLRAELEAEGPHPVRPEPGRLRIFQGLYATVQPGFLQKALVKRGHQCRYETVDHNPNFASPDQIHKLEHPDSYLEHVRMDGAMLLPRPTHFASDWSLNQLLELFRTRRQQYDVFHFNWFLSFLHDNSDVDFLRRDGRAVYFHFRGCFILSTVLTDCFTKQGGSIADACAHCKAQGWREQYFARFHKGVSRANRVFVSTPNLCHCSADFEYLPLSLEPDLELLPLAPKRAALAGPVKILHCVGGPGHYPIKGTEHIRRAVQDLKAEGHDVQLQIIEGMPRTDAVKLFADGDIMVEQLHLGAYGNVALEAMAYGLPVISSLHPSVAHLIPGCPIVHADPSTILDILRELVTEPDKRRELGERCYRFVREFHGNARVAGHLERLYHTDLGLDRLRPPNNLANRAPCYD